MTRITARLVESLEDIEPSAWDALANPGGAPFNPFVAHAFLLALERSGSATTTSGWQGAHLVLEQDGRMVGAAPMYIKTHSYGEYVFDHGWAQAFERAGGQYYPKLQISVPFTPATGPRLLTGGNPDMLKPLTEAIKRLSTQLELSSAHITFQQQAEAEALSSLGFLQRNDQQFHWHNEGYKTFDDFLTSLNSRHRKAIKRERREALASGLTIHALTGSDITEDAWDAFFDFYMETGSRKWGRPYLTRNFFSLIGETMAKDVLLVMARRNGRWIAGAINFIGSDTLFGRNWGAVEHHPFLHFEICYYQAIDFAISRGLKTVEAGAQGEHKIARGYLPQTTYSAHYIADTGLRRAIDEYLKRERAYVAEAARELTDAAPFRKSAEPS